MIRPESAPVYDQIDLKLGIKSSLPSVKPTLALLFLMWREMGRPSELEYATAQGNAIVLRTDIEEALYQRLQEVSDGVTLEQFRDKVNNNLSSKRSLKHCWLLLNLYGKLQKLDFLMVGLIVPKERAVLVSPKKYGLHSIWICSTLSVVMMLIT